MITTGTISGDSASALTIDLPGKRPRTIPSAASVPTAPATTAVRVATSAELAKPRVHCGSVTIFGYNWIETPSGGHDRMLESVKLIGTMTSIGATRKRTVSVPSASRSNLRGDLQASVIGSLLIDRAEHVADTHEARRDEQHDE